jgi:hypothetical protein
MSPYFIIILMLGSRSLTVRIRELAGSLKAGDREKTSVEIVLLLITLGLIFFLISLKRD